MLGPPEAGINNGTRIPGVPLVVFMSTKSHFSASAGDFDGPPHKSVVSCCPTADNENRNTQAVGDGPAKAPRIRNARNLRLAWAGSALSMTAFRTLGVSYPLIALALTGSPMAAGWVGFASTVPGLLLYIPAGALIDHFDPRRVMLWTEAIRGIAAASVFLALLCGSASLPQLLVAALVEGALWVLHSLAENALIPMLAGRDGLRRALARSEMSFHTAVLTGRPLGGFLLGVGQAIPSAVNTVLFFLSFGLLMRMDAKGVRRDARPLVKVGDGLREVAQQPFLRTAMALTAFTNLMVNALTMVFLASSAELSPLIVGVVLAGGGLGGVLGSLVVLRVTPPSYMLFAQVWVWALALFIAAFGGHPAFFAVATLVTGCSGALSNISIRTFEAHAFDSDKIARVASVSRLTSRVAISVAAPLGALLVTCFGGDGATVILFVTMVVVAIIVTAVPALRGSLMPGGERLMPGEESPAHS
ncbi:MFS transporter [Streptosporangium sp. NPDC049078]|uniref:MFS transporter n=2 Tax=unclassified Streptosporangium TaxID=2632669 RepID=UPI00342432B0